MLVPLRLLACAAALFALVACASTGDTDSPETTGGGGSAGDAVAGAWSIETIAGAAIVEGSAPEIVLSLDGALTGDTGVNRMSGRWSGDANDLELSEVAMTRRAGPPELMVQETRLMETLGRARSARLDGDALVLEDAGGDEVLRAKRKD